MTLPAGSTSMPMRTSSASRGARPAGASAPRPSVRARVSRALSRSEKLFSWLREAREVSAGGVAGGIVQKRKRQGILMGRNSGRNAETGEAQFTTGDFAMRRLWRRIDAGEAGIARIGVARMDPESVRTSDAPARLAGWARAAVLEGRVRGDWQRARKVWACGYLQSASGSAFNAEQRARAEADTVKFQEGKYLIVVSWRGGSRAEVTALIRGLQKALQVK